MKASIPQYDRGYRSDFTALEKWCEANERRSSLPAAPDTVTASIDVYTTLGKPGIGAELARLQEGPLARNERPARGLANHLWTPPLRPQAVMRSRMLPPVRPLMQHETCGPAREFADWTHITYGVFKAVAKYLHARRKGG